MRLGQDGAYVCSGPLSLSLSLALEPQASPPWPSAIWAAKRIGLMIGPSFWLGKHISPLLA